MYTDYQQIKKNHSIRIVLFLLAGFCMLASITGAGALQTQRNRPPYLGMNLTLKQIDELKARNSSLIDYAYLSPNATFPRTSKIQKITIHHMAGNLSLEALGESFGKIDRKASSNYAIDSQGRVALYVEERNRSWASSSSENDDQAVTIEVANVTTGGSWPVSDESYEKLIELCVDICQRNGIEKLNYTGDEIGNLTVHNMFNQDTDCPGPDLMSKMPDLAKQVNEKLTG